MNDQPMQDDTFFAEIAIPDDAPEARHRAPSRLKARIYSRLVKRQLVSGPLLSLTRTKQSGRGLCVFENLVQILPVGEKAKTFNCCSVCHARVLGEQLEHAPIFWGNCPYVAFRRS
jgi:hypothetical protein